jgi:cytochrome P450
MASVGSDLENALMAERTMWADGPPHDLFKQMRGECPIHWTDRVTEYPEEKGFWSVTTAEDIHTVSRDWRTYSSGTGVTAVSDVFPLELTQAMFSGMDPPKHDRVKALPGGLHAEADRCARGRDQGDRDSRARPTRGTGELRSRQ